MTTPQFKCRIYANRPNCCTNYPWIDAQITFDDCQFVDNGKIIPFDQLSSDKSQTQLTDYCIKCGRCCYVWSKNGATLQPIAVCKHLDASASAAVCNSDQLIMISIEAKYDFN